MYDLISCRWLFLSISVSVAIHWLVFMAVAGHRRMLVAVAVHQHRPMRKISAFAVSVIHSTRSINSRRWRCVRFLLLIEVELPGLPLLMVRGSVGGVGRRGRRRGRGRILVMVVMVMVVYSRLLGRRRRRRGVCRGVGRGIGWGSRGIGRSRMTIASLWLWVG
jgi:hypothetical protein